MDKQQIYVGVKHILQMKPSQKLGLRRANHSQTASGKVQYFIDPYT